MRKGKLTIIKLLIVVISVLSIDGGRSFLFIGNNIQMFLSKDHFSDIEVPVQHNIVVFNDDEKWVGSLKFDFSCNVNRPVKFLFTLNIVKQEFHESIWQPPKSL